MSGTNSVSRRGCGRDVVYQNAQLEEDDSDSDIDSSSKPSDGWKDFEGFLFPGAFFFFSFAAASVW